MRGSDDVETSQVVRAGTPTADRARRAAWRPGGRWCVPACLLEGESEPTFGWLGMTDGPVQTRCSRSILYLASRSPAVHKILRTRIALGALAASARLAAAAALLTGALALTLAPGARAGLVQSGGPWPRSDRAAAKLVHRSSWEPRADNHSANHTIPDASAAAGVPRPAAHAVRPERHRALHRHDRRNHPMGRAQMGRQSAAVPCGCRGRVVVAHECRREQRHKLRPVPGP